MESIKVSATRLINRDRGERGALRTVREYKEKVEYIHWNPVKAGLVTRPEDWGWSSVHDYTGGLKAPAGEGSAIPVDRVLLPADQGARV